MDAAGLEQNRYHRQMLLAQIGQAGQQSLAGARVLLVGCGALGTVIAEQLVRAGVGFVRIADRDIVELTNLQRQVLFDEEDVREELPKAVAAERRLRRVNSGVEVEARVVDVHGGNIEELIRVQGFKGSRVQEIEGAGGNIVDLILDGTDNVQTRYLINDVAVKWAVPWVYGAVVGSEGRVMGVLPGKTACLRCVFPQPPGVGELATCDTAGVLGAAVGVVASLQVGIAMKILTGNEAAVGEEMITLDLWANRLLSVGMKGARREDCPTCGKRRFEFLDSAAGAGTISLCGRNAVQIRAGMGGGFDLERAADRLEAVGAVQRNPYFVRCVLRDVAGITLSVFPDGRVMVHGTNDAGRARSIAARFVGS